eukprot:CAMPEP_0179172686 /NCGR_PEP_ID=MMETSP0796-20121207/85179_1 /TAXON_ID=73915 /ORGANISM="Pyrodinium bahamense, Strain pbaha01" /LENGTH=59 /DNA_ID=CAMNT_0020875847 /DNA_START=15 /DNA_END=191 /DNA_ORIENTATION=-
MKGQATALDMRQQQFQTAALARHVQRLEATCVQKMDRLVDISQRLLRRMPAAQADAPGR